MIEVLETGDVVRTFSPAGKVRHWMVKPGGGLEEVRPRPLGMVRTDGFLLSEWEPVEEPS